MAEKNQDRQKSRLLEHGRLDEVKFFSLFLLTLTCTRSNLMPD